MPFVLKNKRPQLDKVVQAMVDAEIQADGDLNYVLYKFAKYCLNPSYGVYKNYIGELRECGAQIRSDFLLPYERVKEEENGAV